MPADLSELREKRERLLATCKENGDYSHRLIAEMYSDTSHFVYELLQNADDAGATEACFDLRSDSLIFGHNSQRVFSAEDVESITTVGSSTKKEDLNKIGKFGAGFKSVFQVTDTPRIHSGQYNISIRDYIVPEPIDADSRATAATTFILPFNRRDLSPEKAYSQVLERIRSLEFRSLLFLRNIKEIKWHAGIEWGHFRKSTHGRRARLNAQFEDGGIEREEYLMASRDITVGNSSLTLSVAYAIENDDLVGLGNEPLFVFFPTEQRPGFRFLVHAPFKTTPNRETIPYKDAENELISDELASLIAESIGILKEEGLLRVSSLDILPIDSTHENQVYQKAYIKVKEAFRHLELLPADGGGYVRATNAALAIETGLPRLVSKEDLQHWYEGCEAWVDTDVNLEEYNHVRQYLIDEIEAGSIGMKDVCCDMPIEFWQAKPDEWMADFYAGLNTCHGLYSYSNGEVIRALRGAPIFRLEDGSHVAAEDPTTRRTQVYLSGDSESQFKTIRGGLAGTKPAYDFLTKLGITSPDCVSEVQDLILPRYSSELVEDACYLRDIRRIYDLCTGNLEKAKKAALMEVLRDRDSRFLRCVNEHGDIVYAAPCEAVFNSTNLKKWYENNTGDEHFLVVFPIEGLPREAGRKFLEELGVSYRPKMLGLESVNISERQYYKRSVNGFNPSFDIHGLAYALDHIDIQRSVFAWELLLENASRLKGRLEFKNNQKDDWKMLDEEESLALRKLRRPWLYDKNDQLIESDLSETRLNDLSDKYKLDHPNADKLSEVLGLKPERLVVLEKELREHGRRSIPEDEYPDYQKYRAQLRKKEGADAVFNSDDHNQNQDAAWAPEISPADALPRISQVASLGAVHKDLSNQTVSMAFQADELQAQHSVEAESYDKHSRPQRLSSEDIRKIGRWGEQFAYRYLLEKHPEEDVIWLNQNGNVGEGYDFVVRGNDRENIYYEVKSTIRPSPDDFEVSGTQWEWARSQGEKYILLVLNSVGTPDCAIREVKDPHKLWARGELYADPVRIRL